MNGSLNKYRQAIDTSKYLYVGGVVTPIAAIKGKGKYTKPDLNNVDDINFTVTNAKSISSIAYGKGLYVAVTLNGYVVYSNDGINFNNEVSISGNPKLLYVTYIPETETFVGCGTGTVIYSSNGTSWSSVSVGSGNDLNKLAYTTYSSRYYVVGNGNQVLYSTNLTSWTLVASRTGNWRSIAVNNTGAVIVICGSTGTCRATGGGTSWSTINNIGDCYDISYMRLDGNTHNFGFCIVGASDLVAVTYNGLAYETFGGWWLNPGLTPSGVTYYSVTFCDELRKFVAVGTDGAIMEVTGEIIPPNPHYWYARVLKTSSPATPNFVKVKRFGKHLVIAGDGGGYVFYSTVINPHDVKFTGPWSNYMTKDIVSNNFNERTNY